MKPIIFWGASGQARVLNECMAQLGYQLLALFDSDPHVLSPFPGVPVHYGREGFQQWRDAHADLEVEFLVAMGGSRGRERVDIQRYLETHHLKAAIAIHPTAFVAGSAKVAPGCQILAHAALCADVSLGAGCIVNTAASVDHESWLGAGVHVAPGATLAGCVSIGDGTLIGVGAIVLPRIRIGADVVVGAGSVVTRDVPDGKVVYGNPAKIQRDNS